MKRNAVLHAAVLAISFAACPPVQAQAAPPSGPQVRPIGNGEYEAGLQTNVVDSMSRFARQRQDQWCWAASIQLIMNLFGLPIQQEEIVARWKGALVDEGGTILEELAALQGGVYTAMHTRAYMTPRLIADNAFGAAEILDELSWGRPLLAGLLNSDRRSGHAETITAAHFHLDWDGAPVIDSLVLRDPWPGNPSRQEISFAAFEARRRHVVAIRVWYERIRASF